MNYLISNTDMVSTSSLYNDDYIAHLFGWGKHRYVRREGTPGNYRYIYPEDLKARREARRASNNSNATLFGGYRERRQLRLMQTQQKRFQRQANRAQRRADRAEERALRETAKAQDLTKSERYRKRHALKAERAAKAQLQYMSAVTTANDNVRRGEQFVSSARKAYDASRKIDDIREDILDIGRAALGASVRRAEQRTTNNSQARGSHGLVRGRRG